jgi:hypothetical protein
MTAIDELRQADLKVDEAGNRQRRPSLASLNRILADIHEHVAKARDMLPEGSLARKWAVSAAEMAEPYPDQTYDEAQDALRSCGKYVAEAIRQAEKA